MVGGLVFIWAIEGQVVLLTIILTLVVAGQIHKRTPFSRLIGICHLPWMVMLPWVVWRLATVSHDIYLQVWLGYVVVTVLISLVFDVFDLARFLRGDKVFAWAK
jgi:hypothetical protein